MLLNGRFQDLDPEPISGSGSGSGSEPRHHVHNPCHYVDSILIERPGSRFPVLLCYCSVIEQHY